MLSQSLKTALAAGMLLGGSAFTVSAFAASDGNSTTTTPTCINGKVWDKKKRLCVLPKKSSQLDDDNIYEAARDLAYNRRYEEAIVVLELAENKNDPRILNYLGYSNRKLGRIEKGLTYYAAALREDPDYTLVMEYMGEAFLQLGKVDKAREQLAEIEKRCGKDCREYSMLETEINRHISR
ncbi:MAG: tetratricopeptide repeat protein [Rhizobiaceae bacterium]|nr:tetratricopeptide repeat protein [Rhizobiaceae bacterium]